MIGDALRSMGDVPRRVLDALERDAARADRLIEAAAPDDLVASGAVDELSAGIDLLQVAAAVADDQAPDLAARAPTRPAATADVAAAPARPAAREATTTAATATTAGSASRSGPAAGAGPGSPSEPSARGATSGRAAARTWLAAKATRAGAAAVLDQPIAVSPAAGEDRRARTFETAREPSHATAPTTWPPPAAREPSPGIAGVAGGSADQLARVLDRLAAAPGGAGSSRTTAGGGWPADPARRARAGAGGAAEPARLQDPGPAAAAPRAGTRGRAALPVAGGGEPLAADARAPGLEAPSIVAPAAMRHAAPGEPALAEPPLTGLRRFAMMSEASAPPAPGQVESTAPLGPRGPATSEPAAPPLDDLELSERITRLLRREARRDGIDLEPPP